MSHSIWVLGTTNGASGLEESLFDWWIIFLVIHWWHKSLPEILWPWEWLPVTTSSVVMFMLYLTLWLSEYVTSISLFTYMFSLLNLNALKVGSSFSLFCILTEQFRNISTNASHPSWSSIRFLSNRKFCLSSRHFLNTCLQKAPSF